MSKESTEDIVNDVIDQSKTAISEERSSVDTEQSADTSVHIYLASPFFNDEQREKVKLLESIIEKSGNVTLFSPSRDGEVCPPNASEEQQDRAFQSNIVSITKAQLVVAIIDYTSVVSVEGNIPMKKSDDGTIFEIGMAFASQIPVIAVALDDVHKLNLMLARSFSALCRNEDQAIYNIGKFVQFYSNMNKKLVEYEQMNKELVVKHSELNELMKVNHSMIEQLSSSREDYIKQLDKEAKVLEEIRLRTIHKGEIE